MIAKDLKKFESLHRRTVRVIWYKENSRLEAIREKEFCAGYAFSHEEIVQYIMTIIPQEEVIVETNPEENIEQPQKEEEPEEEKEEMSLTEVQPIVETQVVEPQAIVAETRSVEPQSVVVEPKTVPVEKKEIITAEEIIEQELLRANLKPESTIVRSQEGKSEMAKGAEVAQTAIQPTPQKNIPDSSVK